MVLHLAVFYENLAFKPGSVSNCFQCLRIPLSAVMFYRCPNPQLSDSLGPWLNYEKLAPMLFFPYFDAQGSDGFQYVCHYVYVLQVAHQIWDLFRNKWILFFSDRRSYPKNSPYRRRPYRQFQSFFRSNVVAFRQPHVLDPKILDLPDEIRPYMILCLNMP